MTWTPTWTAPCLPGPSQEMPDAFPQWAQTCGGGLRRATASARGNSAPWRRTTGDRQPPPVPGINRYARTTEWSACYLPPNKQGDPPREPARLGPRRRSCGLPGWAGPIWRLTWPGRQSRTSGGPASYFVRPRDPMEDLRKARIEPSLDRRMKVYLAPKGTRRGPVRHLAPRPGVATAFFTLVSARYVRCSIILVIASAILDRLLHHSHALNIRGRATG